MMARAAMAVYVYRNLSKCFIMSALIIQVWLYSKKRRGRLIKFDAALIRKSFFFQ